MSKKKNKNKIPKHWRKVKKALNEAMKIEMELDPKDKRDCLYFSFDGTVATLLSHLLPDFWKYCKNYSDSWNGMSSEETAKVMEDMIHYFQNYRTYLFEMEWDSAEEYQEYKKKTFGKFYEHFEDLWS